MRKVNASNMEHSNFLVRDSTRLSRHPPFCRCYRHCVRVTFLTKLFETSNNGIIRSVQEVNILITSQLFTSHTCARGEMFLCAIQRYYNEVMGKVVFQFFLNTENFLSLNMNIHIYVKARAQSS